MAASRPEPGLDKLPTAGLPRVRFSESGETGLLGTFWKAASNDLPLSHESDDASRFLRDARARRSGRFSLLENSDPTRRLVRGDGDGFGGGGGVPDARLGESGGGGKSAGGGGNSNSLRAKAPGGIRF